MYARVTKIKSAVEKLDDSIKQFKEETVPMIEKMGGKGGYLLIDRKTGNALAITFWDTEEAMQKSERAANQLRERAGQISASRQPPEVERYEVAAQPAKLAEFGL